MLSDAMAQKQLLQHKINQQMQAVQSAAQPSLPARPPNPDKHDLTEFDVRSLEVDGALDAREALRRFIANAPTWVRAAIGFRLLVTTKLKWHPPIPKEAFGRFELRPGGRIQDFEISTVCTPTKVIAFVQDNHIYAQFEIRAASQGSTTLVTVETHVASKSKTGATHLKLVKGIHKKVMSEMMPGLKIADKNFPSSMPDLQRAGFRQPSKKKLKSQGMLPEQLMERVEKLREEQDIPLVEIPKQTNPFAKLFGKK